MLLSGWSLAPVVSATGSALPKAPTLAPRAMPLSVVAPSAVTLVGSARAARGRCVARRAVQRPRAARIVCAGSGADDYAGMLSRALRTIDTGALGSVPAAAASAPISTPTPAADPVKESTVIKSAIKSPTERARDPRFAASRQEEAKLDTMREAARKRMSCLLYTSDAADE